MKLRELISAWIRFWFAQTSPVPLALFRIAIGTCVLQTAILLVGSDVLTWYGYNGVVPPDEITVHFWKGAPHFDVLNLLPHTDFAVLIYWYFFILSAICLTIGLFTRYASIVVALSLISLNSRMPFNINGGDNMLRLLSIYLCFAESGAAISCDRLIQRWQHPTLAERKTVSIFGQRLMQVQLAIAYGVTAIMKMSGADWLDGVAVYYALRFEEVYRFSIPAITDNLLINKTMTIFTLIVEGAMCSLVWIREFRYWVLAGALLMHVGIDTLMNFPVFEWVFASGLLLFIYPEDLKRLTDRIKEAINSRFGQSIAVRYSPSSNKQASIASVLEGLDIFSRFSIAADTAVEHLTFGRTNSSQPDKSELLYQLAVRLPILWPIGACLWLGRSMFRSSRRKEVY